MDRLDLNPVGPIGDPQLKRSCRYYACAKIELLCTLSLERLTGELVRSTRSDVGKLPVQSVETISYQNSRASLCTETYGDLMLGMRSKLRVL